MKAEEIAKAIYIKCFDDDFKFPEVLNALRICAEENAETIEHLQQENEQLKAQIEKMKCCPNCEAFFTTINGNRPNLCNDCLKNSHWKLKEFNFDKRRSV